LGLNFSYHRTGGGAFWFTGIAAAAAGIAKFLFFLFLVICLIFFIMGISAGRRVP
jgi:uncharacterized membrane protein YtjA (UPF0391 family)